MDADRKNEVERLKGRIGQPGANNENARRQNLLGQFTAKYLSSRAVVPKDIQLGVKLPPAAWINEQLEALNQDWRVRSMNANSDFEIIDHDRKG